MTKVSVIVPVYNTANYLEKCLDSLVEQTLKDIEIIVVNDESPDNAEEIIKKYLENNKNIKYYKKKNGGLSDTRNYALEKSSGEYIAFVDSDDYIDKDMLNKMYSKAVDENLDIVVCDTIEVYPNGVEILKKSNLHYSSDNKKNYVISPPMACTRLYKKAVWKNNKFKKGIYYEDLDITPGLISKFKKVGFVEEGLYYYLQRDNSIMKQTTFSDKLLDIFSVLDNNKNKLYNHYKDEVEYLYISHLLRTATLRFLNYKDNREILKRINSTIKNVVPKYTKNIYYKQSSIKFKIICFLAYHRLYFVLLLIKKLWRI